MLAIIFIALIVGPSQLMCANEKSPINNEGVVHPEIENKTTIKGDSPMNSNIITNSPTPSSTPSLVSNLATSEATKPNLPAHTDQIFSINETKINKLTEEGRNSSSGNGHSLDTSEKTNVVITEGGSNVKTLDASKTNFGDIHGNPRKMVVAEGGVLESAGEKKLNSTPATLRPELDPHSAIIEGMSSMNEGKIIARKGVVLENSTAGDNEVHKTGDILNSSLPNGSSSPVRKPKPAVTDDKDESIGDYIRKMDYIIPIVCTVFSVPLLIVLAIYLYKRGADLWERRHYNRMDFLIEGMYNE